MKIIARRNEPHFLAEMKKARVELEYKDLAKYIDEMVYCQNSGCCEVKLLSFLAYAEHFPVEKIIGVLEHHLSQFFVLNCDKEFDGIVFHKATPGTNGGY